MGVEKVQPDVEWAIDDKEEERGLVWEGVLETDDEDGVVEDETGDVDGDGVLTKDEESSSFDLGTNFKTNDEDSASGL